MSSITVFQFNSQDIRFVDGKPVANDVAAVLGYADPAKTVSTKVKEKNKGVAVIKTRGGNQPVTTLSHEGVLELVSKSRLPKAIEIAEQLGILSFRSLPEQESVRVLETAFADLAPVRQFAVCSYRIDLYLAKANIAIECDENGHSYGYPNDAEREQKIKSVLGCSFVRYNPSLIDFNLGDVVFAVRQLL